MGAEKRTSGTPSPVLASGLQRPGGPGSTFHASLLNHTRVIGEFGFRTRTSGSGNMARPVARVMFAATYWAPAPTGKFQMLSLEKGHVYGLRAPLARAPRPAADWVVVSVEGEEACESARGPPAITASTEPTTRRATTSPSPRDVRRSIVLSLRSPPTDQVSVIRDAVACMPVHPAAANYVTRVLREHG